MEEESSVLDDKIGKYFDQDSPSFLLFTYDRVPVGIRCRLGK